MEAILGELLVLAALARAGMSRSISMAAALCGVLASVAAVAATGCSLVALWTVVSPHVGPAVAALVVAGVLSVLCLVLLALAYAIVRRDRQQPLETDAEASLTAVGPLLSEHKGAALLAALVAGLRAGAGSGGGNR